MYKIAIQRLEFKAIIGVLDFERETPQRVWIDCEIEYEKKGDYVDYAKVASMLESQMILKKYHLIEDALDELIDTVKLSFKEISSIKLTIFKPDILQNSIVSVTKLKKF